MALLGPSRREPCAKCRLPVFIAERLLVGGKTLYHRTCFRCARCQHQLSVANCYETEDGQYCCETCPDEVDRKQDNIRGTKDTLSTSDTLNISDSHSKDTHSLSSVKNDEYSADFESVLESSIGDRPCSTESEVIQDVASSKARTDFMIGQLQWTDEEVTGPHSDLIANSCERELIDRKELHDNTQEFDTVDSISVNADVALDAPRISDNSSSTSVELGSYFSTKTNSSLAINAEKVVEQVPHIDSSIKCSDSDNTPLTANERQKDCLNDQNKLFLCTKESDSTPTSIVKMRMKLFDPDHLTNSYKASKMSLNKQSLDSYSKTDITVNNEFEQLPLTSEDSTKNKPLLINEDESKVLEEVEGDHVVVEEEGCVSSEELNSKKDSCEKSSINNESAAMISNTEASKVILDVPTIKEVEAQKTLQDDEEVVTRKSANIESDLNILIHCTEEDNELVKDAANLSTEDLIKQDETINDVNLQSDVQIIVSQSEETGSITVSSHTKNFADMYPTDLNPFGDEENEEGESEAAAAINRPVIDRHINTNPFGSSDEDETCPPSSSVKSPPSGKPPRPPQPMFRQSLTLGPRAGDNVTASPVQRSSLTLDTKRAADVPNASLNPFWSEGEEPSSDEDTQLPKKTPVPLPRTSKSIQSVDPSPQPRLNRSSGHFGSGTSLSSTGSSANSTITRRKKKPAPPPPLPPVHTHPGLATPPEHVTPTHSITSSPRTTPRHRKARPAPPPPDVVDISEPNLPKRESSLYEIECEREKNEKDVANRSRQRRLIVPTEEQSAAMIAPNKSTFGQWKRKKGPAPPRPVPPQRRVIKVMPMKEVQRELNDIDIQQLGLERQGVKVEKIIREKFEQAAEIDETGITPDVEDLVLQLFEIVNEKNELFRRQAELMYLRRQHRLEEEHADLEYEIRCLLARPDHTKTDTDKAYEEELIQHLVDVVERRNEIVNCLEMDRRREVEEDRSIHHQLASFAAKGKGDVVTKEDGVEATGTNSRKKTLKLLKKKVKRSKEKHVKKKEKAGVDSDKDIDESDSGKVVREKKIKKKWF